MIKLICFLKRNPALTVDQFQDHWRHVHGRLFAETPEIRRYIGRYEQNHRLDADYRRERHSGEVADTGFDGVTVIWYETLADFEAMVADPVYRALVVPDEQRLLDTAQNCWLIAAEPNVIVDKPGGRRRAQAKLLSIFCRAPALGVDEFHRHWREHHGGLFSNVPELNRDILAYDQNPRLPQDYTLAPERAYDGVTEQWFESLDRFVESLSEPKQKELVEPDVAYMLDPARIHFIMSAPPEVIIGD